MIVFNETTERQPEHFRCTECNRWASSEALIRHSSRCDEPARAKLAARKAATARTVASLVTVDQKQDYSETRQQEHEQRMRAGVPVGSFEWEDED